MGLPHHITAGGIPLRDQAVAGAGNELASVEAEHGAVNGGVVMQNV